MQLEMKKVAFKFVVDVEFVQNFKAEPSSHRLSFNWGGKVIRSASINYNQGILNSFERFTISEEFEINEKLDNVYE